jgi:hypothetical protein
MADTSAKRRKVEGSVRHRQVILRSLFDAAGINSAMPVEEAGERLVWLLSTDANREWYHHVIAYMFRHVQRGELLQEFTKEVLKEFTQTTHSHEASKRLMASADLTWAQYEYLYDFLGSSFDPDSGKWRPVTINGVQAPRMLLHRSTAAKGWAAAARRITVHYSSLPTNLPNYVPDVVAYEVPLEDCLSRYFTRSFTRNQYTSLPAAKREQLVLSLNMDGFPVESDLSVTMISIAVTNVGPISKSPLLREPLAIATCSDSEREYWEPLLKRTINSVNEIINTGFATFKVMGPNGAETKIRIPARVRSFRFSFLVITYQIINWLM